MYIFYIFYIYIYIYYIYINIYIYIYIYIYMDGIIKNLLFFSMKNLLKKLFQLVRKI